MQQSFVRMGAILAFLAVALGAFGAHALKAHLPPDRMAIWETAAHYHLIHAVALVLVGILAERAGGARLARAAGWLMAAGILLFSGSLYALAASGITVLGAITPFGGLCFLAAWLCLFLGSGRG